MGDLNTFLAHNPVFSKLTSKDRSELARIAVRKTYQKGDFICWQGDQWTRVLYLSSGLLGWSMLSPDGKRQVVFRVEPTATIWGHSIFDGEPMPASLEVMKDSQVFIWHGDRIAPIISRNVDAVWGITRELVTSMRQVREVVYGFAFHPVAGRLARLLLSHYNPVEGQLTSRDLSLDEMADTVGSTRELVSKTLHRFADDGMIKINRVEFVFMDKNQLEQIAGHD